MRIVLKISIHTLELLIDLPKRFRNWIKVRVLRKHLIYTVTGMKLKKKSKNIAIFAIFPGTSPLASVLRILKQLHSNKYSVLVVINDNEKSKRFVDEISKMGCAILVRTNVGADFGAYQSGIRYLKKYEYYENLNSLILINDSIYVTKSSEKSISRIASDTNLYNCLFLHREHTIHAASMYLKFNREILQSKRFKRFWDFYYPYSNKKKTIKLGEHRLTEIVGLKHFVPYVDFVSISEQRAVKFTKPEIIQILSYSRRFSLVASTYIADAVRFQSYSAALTYAVFNLHVSNSVGLFLNRTHGVPLKMDLVKQGVVSPHDFLATARRDNCKADEILELKTIIAAKGSHTTGRFLERILENKRSIPSRISTLNGKKHPFS
jgi:hypothetical protein